MIVFMIRLKNYLCHNIFNKKNINTFDVLTFIQVRMDENKFLQIRKRSKWVHTNENRFLQKLHKPAAAVNQKFKIHCRTWMNFKIPPSKNAFQNMRL